MINRILELKIKDKLFNGKIILIYGARQVGKTTIIKKIADDSGRKVLYLNCDNSDIRTQLTDTTATGLKNLTSGFDMVLIDEAQRVKNIGLTLKLFADELSDKQVIATGSSSLELSNIITEPLTGRKYEFHLFPFSIMELVNNSNAIEFNRLLEERIIYGMYPDVLNRPGEKQEILKSLASDYLFKDVLAYQDVRKPEQIENLLMMLAAQIGQEVSYNKLANSLQLDNSTIVKYINLLEKAFVIFSLKPFSKNVRIEVTKKRKIYFYDTGIRNALLRQFSELNYRRDTGALWENFLISERLKHNSYYRRDVKSYFWRTTQQQEIDYIEDDFTKLKAFEIKWSKLVKARIPSTFLKSYPNTYTNIINPENYLEFVNERSSL